MFLKLTLFLSITLGLISCHQEVKSNLEQEKPSQNDTIIVKQKNEINKSYEVGFISRSFTYYWLAGKDTLDFLIEVREDEKDSALNLSAYHNKPILFTTALNRMNDCFKYIKEDFSLSKLNSFYFESPVLYFDLEKELSNEYEKEIGNKDFSYTQLNQFLLHSNLNKILDSFVSPLGKKIKQYNIEKFHFIERKNLIYYQPDVDTTAYPEFIINGGGMDVKLANK